MEFPAPTIRWQVSTGGEFSNIEGATSTTYTFTAYTADNGNQYRAIFTNIAGEVTTEVVDLTLILVAPVITLQPDDQTFNSGESVSFVAGATGVPTPTVRWQLSTGGEFSNIEGATSTTYTFTAYTADNGNQYRAIFTNSEGEVTTEIVDLTLILIPIIVLQPTNQTFNNGEFVSFTAEATGVPTPTVRWQLSTGGEFSNIEGATSTTYTFTAYTADNGNQYRAIFTNLYGETITNIVYLILTESLQQWNSSLISDIGFECKAKNYQETKIKYIIVRGAIIPAITICSQPELQKYLNS